MLSGDLPPSALPKDAYDRLLREQAGRVCAVISKAKGERWLAKACGFESPEALRMFEDALAAQPPEVSAAFLEMRQSGAMALERYRQARQAAWDEGYLVEWFDKGQEHDSAEWKRSRGIESGTKALISVVSSTNIRGRRFNLHFRSTNYPFLEDALRHHQNIRRRFEETVRRHQ